MLRLLVSVVIALACVWSARFARAQQPGTDGQGSAEAPIESEESEADRILGVLGSYERAAVNFALKKRGFEIEPEPEGKTIGRVHVYNLDVFGNAEGFLRVVNFLHITTREHVIEREVLLRPGKPWKRDLVNETRRRLKDPLFTSFAAVAPVKSTTPDKVDVLVVTRDLWSLRTNMNFEYVDNFLTEFHFSVAENNILGLRKHGAFSFDMSQGNFSLGPQYVDKALGGTRLRLSAFARAIFAREDSAFEGTSSNLSLVYPLWRLASLWGGSVSVRHFDSTIRNFFGNGLRLYDNPDTDEVEEIPFIYGLRTAAMETSGVRSFGHSVKQRVTLGHQLSLTRPSFRDDFIGNEVDRAAFERDVFPRSERVSALFLRYNLFTPRFTVYRNLNAFNLAEDVRLGPELSAQVTLASQVLGSEFDFTGLSLSAGWSFDIAKDGFVNFTSSASTRIQDEEPIDNFFSGQVRVALPRMGNVARIVARSNLSGRYRERSNRFLTLGGNNGLRGYLISEFAGQKRFVTNIELRSMPMKVLFAQVGGTLFWDMGHAADRLEDLSVKHGVGFGMRYLIPQLQPFVFRLDWAFPLADPRGGFPGRISAGVAQAF